jgi:hypothetical protein
MRKQSGCDEAGIMSILQKLLFDEMGESSEF